MAGKGRPKVEDKRDNQYRVRLNDFEDRMLEYSSKALGIPKSEIFRRALKMYYNSTLLTEYESQFEYEEGAESNHISLKRVIECPYCSIRNRIDFEEYCTDVSYYERHMGSEVMYSFECDNYVCQFCNRNFYVGGSISEYPIGAYDSEHIEIRKLEGE